MSLANERVPEEGLQTKDRIVVAAARLFSRKGYSGTSMADISHAMQMTKGALYHHFEGKETIFLAVVERIRNVWRSKVARDVISSRDAVEQLEILMDRQAQFLQAEDNYCQLLNGLMTEMDGVNTDFLGLLQAVYSELARFIEQIVVRGQKAKQIRQDVEPSLIALAIVGILQGAGSTRPVSERLGIDFESMMATMKKVVVKGLVE